MTFLICKMNRLLHEKGKVAKQKSSSWSSNYRIMFMTIDILFKSATFAYYLTINLWPNPNLLFYLISPSFAATPPTTLLPIGFLFIRRSLDYLWI